jgi:hypothetical protein
MPGIRNLSIQQFQERLNRFDTSYVIDWNEWIDSFNNNYNYNEVAYIFGMILRRWQACRPNSMRRSQNENDHEPPYLEHLLNRSSTFVDNLVAFDLRNKNSFCDDSEHSIKQLWNIFTDLSYSGKARNGKAGVVGISKAVLLLTKGRVGPAFDSKVRQNLSIKAINNAQQWINALKYVTEDIMSFEQKNNCSIYDATPNKYSSLHVGRIYDMALGPGITA